VGAAGLGAVVGAAVAAVAAGLGAAVGAAGAGGLVGAVVGVAGAHAAKSAATMTRVITRLGLARIACPPLSVPMGWVEHHLHKNNLSNAMLAAIWYAEAPMPSRSNHLLGLSVENTLRWRSLVITLLLPMVGCQVAGASAPVSLCKHGTPYSRIQTPNRGCSLSDAQPAPPLSGGRPNHGFVRQTPRGDSPLLGVR
jgi:hypothetical protein